MDFSVFTNLVSRIKKISFGDKVEFSTDSLPIISEFSYDKEIYIETRQRFTSNGLIDNLIFHLSKKNSINLGLWILAAYFQKNHRKYVLHLDNSESKVKEIWIDFGDMLNPSASNLSQLKINLEKFDWKATNVEDFVSQAKFYYEQKVEIYLTNETKDFSNMEQFYDRKILIGFGEIGGGVLLAEFFLNFGLTPSNINYEYIKYEFSNNNLASENSCEIRAELINPQTVE